MLIETGDRERELSDFEFSMNREVKPLADVQKSLVLPESLNTIVEIVEVRFDSHDSPSSIRLSL